MALDLFSESWATWPPAAPSPAAGAATSSPRISFSRDLDGSTSHHHHHIHHQHRTDISLLDSSSSSPDFDFCVSGDRPEQQYSYGAADELFSDGFLLPLPLLPTGAAVVPSSAFPSLSTRTANANATAITKPSSSSSSSVSGIRPVSPLPAPPAVGRKDGSEEISTVPSSGGGGGATEEKPASGKQPTSFWKFGRSSSLNCSGAVGGTGGRRASLICSLPLLSRSKSTGSHPSPPTLKQRQQSFNGATAIPTPSTATAAASGSKLSRKGSGNGGTTAARNPYYYGQHQQGGGGVRISPVLNVPPPYIPKGSGAGLFSFGRLLCSSSRERSRKKTQQPAPPPQQSS